MNDEERHDEILIGRCENQALELLKNNNFQDDGVKKAYKLLVKTLYTLNLQVEAELLHPKPEIEIYKPCPKCKEQILKNWPRHDKCGWKA